MHTQIKENLRHIVVKKERNRRTLVYLQIIIVKGLSALDNADYKCFYANNDERKYVAMGRRRSVLHIDALKIVYYTGMMKMIDYQL